jgi:exonuclease III
MNILCWNVRGLNSPFKQHEVAGLMKSKKFDVCGLLETKLSSSKVAFMQKFWLKNWKFVSNAEIANTARIVLLWNPSTISIEVINLSAQGIHVVINNMVT